MNKDNAPKEFWIYPQGKEIDEEVKIPWEEENQWRNRRHRFLGSWFHPRAPRFHGGINKSPMGVLGSPPRLKLEKRRVRSESCGERVSSVQGVIPVKIG
jgi:hypothetical protein